MFTREPFLMPGEDPAEVLAPGSAKRRALDDALAELDAGHKEPSTEWRRNYSLMLGLERVLSDDEPRLADGTLLNPHQVDALSGTLTALLAEAQARRNGTAPPPPPAEEDEPAPVVEAEVAPAPADVDADADADDDDFEFDEDDEDEEEVEPEPEDVSEDEEPLDYSESDEQLEEAAEDPNAHKRFWFEHATGAGKTVAAMGFVEASKTGGILILTHRRNLVDQFHGELKQRGYGKRVTPPLMKGKDAANGPVTVETYQWFVRNAGNISSAYTVVICDEAHTALGEKTAAAIRQWTGPIFIGMTATGALIARHVTDLFPTQTSRFDLAQAARRGVIAPLRCVRIPPGPGVRTIAKVPLRRGEVDTEFDQEMLAELLDQIPFNLAAANLYKTRFNGLPGVVYAAGVRHAYNLAEAFREEGIKAMAVSGETKKRDLAEILARYERGEIDVLVNAQLLAEGWNSPRATVCFHLAPTASKRIYQQRVGRVTRRQPGKEAGIVVDFVHPGTKHDDPVVTLHSLLDRDVYRGGAIVVGPVRRGRGRRVRVERRVLPVASDENRRIEVFERELWRIAVEHLDWGEQIQWAALAGARVAPSGWRRARAMLHFDRSGELKRTFLLTAVQRNKNPQLRVRALQEIAASRDAEAFDLALDEVGGWPRDEKREACKSMLQALAEKRIGRRDQADAWIWRIAGFTADLHEEYAVQRWPETKRLLGLLANSSGGGHARNARRVVHAARKQDRRLAAALLAAAIRYTHTPEAEELLRGARTRMARKPSSLSRELLRNFPKGRRGRGRRRKKKGAGGAGEVDAVEAVQAAAALLAARDKDPDELTEEESALLAAAADEGAEEAREQDEAVGADGPRKRRRRRRRPKNADPGDGELVTASEAPAETAEAPAPEADEQPKPRPRRSRAKKVVAEEAAPAEAAAEAPAEDEQPKPKPRRSRAKKVVAEEAAPAEAAAEAPPEDEQPKPKPRRSRAKKVVAEDAAPAEATADVAAPAEDEAPKPKPRRSRAKKVETPAEDAPATDADEAPKPKPKRASRAKKAAPADEGPSTEAVAQELTTSPRPRRRTAAKSKPVEAAADALRDAGESDADAA
jgi:superfamily II DNA or RNA helicase